MYVYITIDKNQSDIVLNVAEVFNFTNILALYVFCTMGMQYMLSNITHVIVEHQHQS